MKAREVLTKHYEENYDKMVGHIRRRPMVTPEDAEDIVQDSYARALAYIDSFQLDKDFNNWFLSVMNNCYKRFRSKLNGQVDEAGHSGNEEFDEEFFPMDEPRMEGHHKMVRNIRDIIGRKENPLRQVLYLYFVREYSPSEICVVVTDLAHRTVRQYIHEFKREMRERYSYV